MIRNIIKMALISIGLNILIFINATNVNAENFTIRLEEDRYTYTIDENITFYVDTDEDETDSVTINIYEKERNILIDNLIMDKIDDRKYKYQTFPREIPEGEYKFEFSALYSKDKIMTKEIDLKINGYNDIRNIVRDNKGEVKKEFYFIIGILFITGLISLMVK